MESTAATVDGGGGGGRGGGDRIANRLRWCDHVMRVIGEDGRGRLLPAFVFVCNEQTMGECMHRSLFGTVSRDFGAIHAIGPDTRLFLLNRDTRMLYGVWQAADAPARNIVPSAWAAYRRRRGGSASAGSRFPSQVRVTPVAPTCPPRCLSLEDPRLRELGIAYGQPSPDVLKVLTAVFESD